MCCLSVIVGYILRYGNMVSRVDENVGIGPTRDVRRGFRDANACKLTSVDHDWVAYPGHARLSSRPNTNGYHTAKSNVRNGDLDFPILTMVLAGLHRLPRQWEPRYPDVTAVPPAEVGTCGECSRKDDAVKMIKRSSEG